MKEKLEMIQKQKKLEDYLLMLKNIKKKKLK